MSRMTWPSGKELEVLRLLDASVKGMYGLELVEKSGGAISSASVYVYLSRLVEKGYVDMKRPASSNHPGPPRPTYKINGEGARALAAAELMASARGYAHG